MSSQSPRGSTTASFYALPQSPQLAKQLLMVAQLRPLLPDRPLPAGRGSAVPTASSSSCQLDMVVLLRLPDGTTSWRTSPSPVLVHPAEAATGERPPPIERMTWAVARDRYGTDKPDLRFGLELIDLSDGVRGTRRSRSLLRRRRVKAIRACPGRVDLGPVQGAGRGDRRAGQDSTGAAGLAWFRVAAGSGPDSGPLRAGRPPGPRPLGAGAFASVLHRTPTKAEPGRPHPRRLGHLRHGLRGARCAARGDRRPPGGSGPASIRVGRGLPDVRRRRGRNGQPAGSAPSVHDALPRGPAPCWPTDPSRRCVREAYDLVLNGWELGSGSVRIHDSRHRRRRCSPRSASGPEEAEYAVRLPARAPSATGRRPTPGSPWGSTGSWFFFFFFLSRENITRGHRVPPRRSPGPDPC